MFSYRVSFSWYFKFQIMDIYYICRFFCYKLTPILKFWIYNPSCRTSDGQDTCETTLASKTETLYIQIALWWPWQHWCCLELLHTDEPKTELNKEEIWKNKDCSLPIGGIYTTLDTGHLQLCCNFFVCSGDRVRYIQKKLLDSACNLSSIQLLPKYWYQYSIWYQYCILYCERVQY